MGLYTCQPGWRAARLAFAILALTPGLTRAAEPLLTDIGRDDVQTSTIKAVFDGGYNAGDTAGFRLVFQTYVLASFENCGKNTPHGTTVMTKTTTTRKRDVFGFPDEEKSFTHYDVDVTLAEKFEVYFETLPPGMTVWNAPSYGYSYRAIRQDFERLFSVWKCNGPEIRQFQENLRRIAYARPTLQASRGVARPPLHPGLKAACQTYLGSSQPDPSGYTLTSCECLRQTAGDVIDAGNLLALRTHFDATQLAVLSWTHNRPALLQSCIVKEARGGGSATAYSSKGVLVRKNGYEYREPETGAWCGPTARVDLIYAMNSNMTGAIQTQTGSVVSDFVPWLEQHCPRANQVAVSLYRYGQAELIRTQTFAWVASGGAMFTRSTNIPKTVVKRRKVVYAPPPDAEPENDAWGNRTLTLGGLLKMATKKRKKKPAGPLPEQSQQCVDAKKALYERYLGEDACAVSAAQLERAADELQRVHRSSVCRGKSKLPSDEMRTAAEQRCRVQREGSATRFEAELYQRLKQTRGCRPITDPYEAWETQRIRERIPRTTILAELRNLRPRSERLKTGELTPIECAGRHLLAIRAVGHNNDAGE